MKSIGATLIFCTFVLISPAQAQDHPTYQGLWDSVRQKPGCATEDYPDFLLVTCKEDLTFWYFTKPNHPAYPGVIQRTIFQENGAWDAQEHGYSFASDSAQPAFKTWLAQIADLDRQMKNYIEKQHIKGAQ